ncbi:DnaJ domain-containing protein [Candidatus Nitrosotenuis sp. DW1]|uniref:DnaJ domain-containing protein n=1 Tax=Candidatus Nitrosotenuis sp. DW1 TaxID=2259672 RepID=UPI0015CCAAB3|nr:DnaJ domain-containing protein [Candidatus Nitrosotenuis sp. DW1]QLH09081.1 molecular chaperone DnaJ [Candidatus Nitrosotenuis sp. DW1]
MNSTDAYQILKINPGSSFDEIKYAYRKLALESHPDKNTDEVDGTKFKKVTEAYHMLKKDNRMTNAKNKESAPKYTEPKTKKEKNFTGANWGARPGDSIPEEDWTRYTKQTEQSDPFFWKSYVAEFWKNYESKSNQAKKPYDFKIIQEPEPDLSVNVDHSLCIGCCSCEIIAPQVFAVDKLSKMNPKSSVINQKGAKPDKIMDAAQTCPTKAISVEEEETKKRLYPY